MKSRYFSNKAIQNPYIEITDIISMNSNKKNEFITKFNQNGFVIFKCSPLPIAEFIEKNLLGLSSFFGTIKRHNRSKENGISVISTDEGYMEQYLATTNLEHPLHTDGPFETTPPKIVALHCEKQSATGGDTQIVSSCLLYEYLLNYYPTELKLMFQQNAFTCNRDNQTATVPFFKVINNLLHMVYRLDNIVKVDVLPELHNTFHNIIKEFISRKENQIKVKLNPNELAVFDNTAILHGRSAYEGNRRMNRLWLNADNIEYSEKLQIGFVPNNKSGIEFLKSI